MRSLLILLLLFSLHSKGQHPVAFATKADFDTLRIQLQKYPLLKSSYEDIKRGVDAMVGKDVDVPVPKDAQGGYTHDRHKENYMLMFHAGLLYNISKEKKYAGLVKNILLKYATLNPGLKKHPQATSSSPGHIFWQALNDANWLVYTGLAYDLIQNTLTPSEKKRIEERTFKPEVDFITKDLESWFNLIHNHGVWACAGVGIVGIATDNDSYVKKALYGTKEDGKSGFLALMDGLFSPDGYYTEGPYYVRYAILPYYLFANALHRSKPQLNIFQYRGAILRKALHAGLQQTNINGGFFPLNDALKDKDYTTNELVTAIAIARNVYGKDESLLPVAQKQDRVVLHKGGALLAADLGAGKWSNTYYPYTPVEYTDGKEGKEGGVSLLRTGKGKELTTVFFKYASHGLSHGHYDRLNYFLYHSGDEVLQDYGAVRFIGVEQKYGGRYLPENKTYAAQTVAHNTVVVDEQSHFDGKEAGAEQFHSEKWFSDLSKQNLQVVSAAEKNAYKDVDLYRTLYLVQLPGMGKPLLVDVFRTESESDHQYDLPFQFSGTVIQTSFKYEPFTSSLQTLGKKNGYQFLWKEAEARLGAGTAQLTFLKGSSFYTISSLVTDSAAAFFTRSGANDPNFNLRREPSFIIRKKGKAQSFVSVVEIHGKMDPVIEISTNAYPSVESIASPVNNAGYTLIEIIVKGKKLRLVQSNRDPNKTTKHSIESNGETITWTGPYSVQYDGKPL